MEAANFKNQITNRVDHECDFCEKTANLAKVDY